MQILVKRGDAPFIEYLFTSSERKKNYLFRGAIIKSFEDLLKVKEVFELDDEEFLKLQEALNPDTIVVIGAIFPVEVNPVERKVVLKKGTPYGFLKYFPYEKDIEIKVGKYLKNQIEWAVKG